MKQFLRYLGALGFLLVLKMRWNAYEIISARYEHGWIGEFSTSEFGRTLQAFSGTMESLMVIFGVAFVISLMPVMKQGEISTDIDTKK